ncbi:hypothetical protein ACTJI6_17850, partial [Paracoccus sp. 22332]
HAAFVQRQVGERAPHHILLNSFRKLSSDAFQNGMCLPKLLIVNNPSYGTYIELTGLATALILRRRLCRDTDPNLLSPKELRQLCAGLTAKRRKCLGFRTPAEVFKANLLGRGHRREKFSRQPKSNSG